MDRRRKKTSTRKPRKRVKVQQITIDTLLGTPPDINSPIKPPINVKLPKPKKTPWKFILFFVLFVIGANMLALAGMYQLYRKTILSFKVAPVTTVSLAQRRGLPTRVEIPTQHIDLPITEAAIKDGVWETSQTSATHLNTSARPLEAGNVVIYGHNLLRLFGKIRGLKKGDSIIITTNEGKRVEYKVDDTLTVKPDNVEPVLPTTHEELTLYTCTGFLDSERFVVQASPTQVTSW